MNSNSLTWDDFFGWASAAFLLFVCALTPGFLGWTLLGGVAAFTAVFVIKRDCGAAVVASIVALFIIPLLGIATLVY